MTVNDFGGCAIVTGGGSGIGLATAAEVTARGGRVAVLDLEPSGAGDAYIGVTCDVTDGASVDAAVATAAERLGGIDIVVNNAGIGAQGTVADNDDDEWRRVLDVNVVGIVRTVPRRAAAPASVPARGDRQHGLDRRRGAGCPTARCTARRRARCTR